MVFSITRPLLAACLALAASFASANDVALSDAQLSRETFPEAAQKIRREMEPGGHYGELAPAKRDDVEQALSQIDELLVNGNSSAAAAIRTSQQRINRILGSLTVAAEAPAERICKRERKIGSNRAELVCRNRADIEAEAARSRESISQMRER